MNSDRPRIPYLDAAVTVLLGIFCLIGSVVWVAQYSAMQKAKVERLDETVQQQGEQIETAKKVAIKAERVAKTHAKDCGIEETDRRVAALRLDVNHIKKRLGIP